MEHTYKLEKFEKENLIIGDSNRDGFVALISKVGEEQPYRIVIENFESKEDAMAEVNKWIAQREFEDAQAPDEKEKAEKKDRENAVLESLNSDLL